MIVYANEKDLEYEWLIQWFYFLDKINGKIIQTNLETYYVS